MMRLVECVKCEKVKEKPNDIIINRYLSQFFEYADKIITAIIHVYHFTYYAEYDDLMQEARIALLLAIEKQQFDTSKGSIFNFVSMVSSRNLINYTKKHTRYNEKNINNDISNIFNDPSLMYVQDFEKELLLDDVLQILLRHFQGKEKFEDLCYLLIEFYKTHRSSKFIKKHFVQYAKSYNYSSSIINTFFEMIKRSKFRPEVKIFLEDFYG